MLSPRAPLANRPKQKPSRRPRHRPQLEELESRVVPIVYPAGEQFLVSQAFSLETDSPAIAVLDATGAFAAVWESYEEGADYLGYGVYAQRFSADGSALGDKILVSEDGAVGTITGDQMGPAVASDGSGNFLVVWQSKDQEAGDFDIHGRWFVGGQFQDVFLVNQVTTGDQTTPAVAMDTAGNAVVVWQSDGQDGDGFGIYAKRYTLGQTDPSSDTLVNTLIAGNQTAPDVAMTADGRHVITWQGEDLSSGEPNVEVYARRSSATGSALDTTELHVNTVTLRDQVTPQVAIDNSANFVVVWVSEGIPGSGSDVFGQRFSEAGTAQGGEFRVNPTILASQVAPDVGMKGSGEFLVTWQSVHLDGFSWGIYGHEYAADGTTVAGKDEFLINNTVMGPQTNAAIAVRPDGTAIIGWVGNDATHKPAVHAKRYDLPGTTTPGNVADMVLANFVALEDAPADAAMDAAGNSVVVWTSYGEDGDGLGVYAVRLDSQGEWIGAPFLVNVGQELGNQSDPAVAVAEDGRFVVVWQSDDSQQAGHDVWGQRYDALGNAVGTAFRVNTTVGGDQSGPTVAMAADGRFVVVWQGPDAEGYGIYAQRYDSNGLAVGGELLVNHFTALDQVSPTVAMNAEGEFVIGWVSDHPAAVVVGEEEPADAEKSIFVQWFDAAGTATGDEVITHEYVKDAQEHPDVGIDAAGNFVVVWQSINQEGMAGAGWGVYGRRFNSDKQPLGEGAEFHVNETTNGPQRYPSVGVDALGNFVVAWQSNSHLQDGSSWEVYARQYDMDGVPEQGEERVNTWSEGPQINPVVARASTGSFGVFWSGQGAAHTEGTHGRIYDVNQPPPIEIPSRQPLGDQFLVGETFALEGSAPDIVVLPTGYSVATWESFEQDGSGWGVYAQLQDPAGQPVGTPFLVNTTVAGDQHAPAVAADANGNFLVVWQSGGEDADGYDVYAQWYHIDYPASAPPVVSRIGGEFLVNTTTTAGDQVAPDVAIVTTATGPIALVTWQAQDSEGGGIKARWYAGTADTVGSGEIAVNTLQTGDQAAPAVSSNGTDRFVIVWQGPAVLAEGETEASLEIYGQRFLVGEASGQPTLTPDGVEFVVNSILTHDQVTPAVAMAANGAFVVAFVAEGQEGSGADVYARRFNAAGVAQGDDVLVNTVDQRPQVNPAVGMNAAGDYLITWQSSHQEPDPFAWGIFGHAYNANGVTLAGEFLVNTLTSGPQTTPAVGVNAAGNAVVTWVGLDSSHQPAVHAALYTLPAIDTTAAELILANYLAPEESPPAAGMDAEGNSLVVWQSYLEDGSGLGVFGQRIDAAGKLIGSRLAVNSFTAGNQSNPDVAVNANGDAVVVWQSQDQDGSGYGIYAQRYDRNGAVGGEFRVNTTVLGDQTLPTVAIAADGSFVVAWQSADVDLLGIFAQRFDRNGNAVGGEFQVNQQTALDQFGAAVAMNASGQFVVTWVSDHPAAVPDTLDTEKSVFAQWYDASGNYVGEEVLVHEFVKDGQEHPDVAIGPDGRFVVTWQSINQDGNTWGVFARQFEANKEPVQRREFLVNETRSGPQRYASVSMDQYGRFVITWQSNSFEQDGSSWDLFSQQYTAAAVPEGGELAVNTFVEGPQIHPVLAQAPDGRFGVYWIGRGYDKSEGVQGRLYTPFLDRFDRADASTLGPHWTEVIGDIHVANNEAQGAAADSFAVLNLMSIIDVGVQAEVTNLDASEYVGLIARYGGPDFSNFYQGLLYNSAGTSRAVIYRNVNGVWAPISTNNVVGAASAAIDQTLRFEVVGSSQKLFLGDELVAFANDTAITGAGSVGMRVLGTASLDDFFAELVPHPSATMDFLDTFDSTPDAQLEDVWSEKVGNFLVDGEVTGNAADSFAVLNGVSEADVFVEAKVKELGTWEYVGLVGRYGGPGFTNFYQGLLYNAGGTARAVIYRNVNGAWTAVSTDNPIGPAANAKDQTLRFEVVGSSQKLFLGDKLVAFANDTAITGAGSVGMRILGAASLDDFSAAPLPPLPGAVGTYKFDSATRSQLDRVWSEKVGNFAVDADDSNVVTGNAADSFAVLNGVLEADVEVQATVKGLGTWEYVGLIGRYSGPGFTNFYQGLLYNAGGTLRAVIYSNVNGVWTAVSTDNPIGVASSVLSSTSKLRLVLVGSSQKLFLDDDLTPVAFANDTAITGAGSVGMRILGAASLDDFIATKK